MKDKVNNLTDTIAELKTVSKTELTQALFLINKIIIIILERHSSDFD